MTPPSDDLDDLTGALRRLYTLIDAITERAIDIIDPEKVQCDQTKKELNEVTDLLWIARDIAEAVAGNGEAVHRRVVVEKNALRNGGAK